MLIRRTRKMATVGKSSTWSAFAVITMKTLAWTLEWYAFTIFLDHWGLTTAAARNLPRRYVARLRLPVIVTKSRSGVTANRRAPIVILTTAWKASIASCELSFANRSTSVRIE